MPCLRRDVILSVARSLFAVCCALGQAAPPAPANDAAPAHSPADAKALHLRALEHAEAGRFEAALADVDAAIEHSPDAALTLGLKGSILMRMERFTDAVAAFSRSLAIEPRAQVHFDRGFCHSNLGDFARAIDDYSAAYKLDSTLNGLLDERGVAYLKTGDFRRAVNDLERARKRSPDDPRSPLLLSWIYATAPDDTVRDGRKALVLVGELCDPVTCQTTEPLNVLAAAYADLGDFEKATKLQERAVALSHFAPEFHADSIRRLELLRKRRPIREAATPLFVLPRPPVQLPRAVGSDEALAAPPDVLGDGYLQVQTLLLHCTLAKAGAVIDTNLDGLPLSITSDNADQVRKRLEDRIRVYADAIRTRGFAQLAAGYRAQAAGGCNEWGLSEEPWLVEQDGFKVHFTQGDVRHMGVVVESAVAFRHDMNTAIILTGVVKDANIAFVTPQRYGITGTAHDRCTLTLTPDQVAGPEWAKAFAGRALARRSYGAFAPALADLDRAIQMAPSPELLALRAYALAAWPDNAVRDGRRAVASAQQALALSGDKPDMYVLAAAAVAAAEAGDFDDAVSFQRRGLALAPEEARPAFEARLRLFESDQPFHEEALQPDR